MIEQRLLKIDDAIIHNHCQIQSDDLCYYFGDYYGRQSYGHSPMNQLIFNLKKHMDKKGQPDWPYKEKAIEAVADTIYALKSWHKIKQYTWIPIPSSKVKTDPAYDDRLMKILIHLRSREPSLDVRELLTIKSGRMAAHDPKRTTPRPTVKDHQDNLQLDKKLLEPKPNAIIIFDDVITTGASYKAVKKILQEKFQETLIIGIFIARTILN